MSDTHFSADGDDEHQRSWLERISDAFLRDPRDREELIQILRDAQQRDLLDIEALAMIEGVLQVAEMQVRDIMVPRNQMVVVERDARPEDYLPVLVESAHSRFPVIGEDKDEVVGILLAKDLLSYFAKPSELFDIREILRPVVFIPESKRLNVLLKEFRASRNHMAVVVDEYGGVSGLVTIEDVLEQIVGEIEDEHDYDEGLDIIRTNDGSYAIKALTPINDFNETFGTHFDDEDFDTVGGLVLSQFGHMPKRGETIALDRCRFTVVRADNRRIHLLRMTLLDVPAQESSQGQEPPANDASRADR